MLLAVILKLCANHASFAQLARIINLDKRYIFSLNLSRYTIKVSLHTLVFDLPNHQHAQDKVINLRYRFETEGDCNDDDMTMEIAERSAGTMQENDQSFQKTQGEMATAGGGATSVQPIQKNYEA